MRPGVAIGRWAPLLGAACLLLPLRVAAGPERDALGWLERIRSAAVSANYTGTLVFSAGGSMTSSRVWHYWVAEQTYERVETQDGRMQRVLRHNDEVRTLWPQSKVAVVERRDALAGRSGLPHAIDARALENYELRQEGFSRIAGRDAAVLLMQPRDALRFAQRLWVDRASGLMLRADVLGGGGAPLETTAFSDVEIGIRPQPESILQAMREVDATESGGRERSSWRVLRPPQQPTRLEAEGWALRERVPGFELVGCMARGIVSAGAELAVVQAVFSDGLTHVSLFVEPYRAERHRKEIEAQRGANHAVTRRHGEFWITAVGDVPAATLRQFADALERRR